MVKIIDFKERETKEGDIFYSLVVQGDVEFVESKETGRYYATAKKAFVACTFDESTCAALIGSEIPGSIKREECEPYEYVNTDTGEVSILSHTNVYSPEESSKDKPKIADFANIAEIARPISSPVIANETHKLIESTACYLSQL